ILQAHHSIEAKPLDQVRSDLPAELAGVVAKMMAKDPEDRFQTPAQAASVLARVFKKGSLASSPRPEAKPGALGSAAVERPEVPRPTTVTEGGSDQAAAVGPFQVRSIPTWFTVAAGVLASLVVLTSAVMWLIPRPGTNVTTPTVPTAATVGVP